MNVSDLISNSDAPPVDKSSPEAQRSAASQPPPPAGAQPPTPGSYGVPSQQQTPLYPPHATSAPRVPQSGGPTPLQTPSQAPGAGQYPFPYQTAQSPAGAGPGQQYRPFEGYSSATSSVRPQSRGHPLGPPGHSPYGQPGAQQTFHAHATSSLSPTPPSQHSQTPHSLRQSPHSVISHAPGQQVPLHQYQYSQPGTPFGPPSLQHQRTFSGASNNRLSGSPAQPHSSVGNLVGSPSAYNRSSTHLRRTSDYLSYIDRERSVSVSPKTKIPPRPPSLTSSQHSSYQEIHSNRNSLQQTNTVPVLPTSLDHVQQHVAHYALPQQQGSHFNSQPPNAAAGVAQATPSSARTVPNLYAGPPSGSPLFQSPRNQGPPPPVQHHSSERMELNSLLTPTSEIPPTAAVNGSSDAGSGMALKGKHEPPNIFMKSSPKPKRPAVANAPPQTEHQPVEHDAQGQTYDSAAPQADTKSILKRPAESEAITEPPAKKQRPTRKYPQRPIWARLSKHNPRYNEQEAQDSMPNPSQSQNPYAARDPAQTNGTPRQGQNGQQQPQGPTAVVDGRPPWQQDVPLDDDLIRMRQILGKQWEKTFKWNTPYPDMLKVVQDWLFVQLDQLGDVGRDASEGTIEIEAKIGTLMQDGSDDRCQFPVMNATVLSPHVNNRYHFESQMTLGEHRQLNLFLNKTIQSSMERGRAPMQYKHLHETDTFHTLSPLGLSLIPQALQRRRDRKVPTLRVTTDTKNPQRIIARIVKVHIADLHIYNPQYNYDCRITVNLEVNLESRDLATSELIEEPSEKEPQRQTRIKDRMSYKHLAYSIDLTKVETAALAPKFELELEVDANVLREQMQLLKEGQESAFGDVVGGFLDNATFLMRQQTAT